MNNIATSLIGGSTITFIIIGVVVLLVVILLILVLKKNSKKKNNKVQSPVDSNVNANSNELNNNTNLTADTAPMFNQNINTDINQNVNMNMNENTNLNNQVETPVVPTMTQVEPSVLETTNQEPVVSSQPEINFVNPVNTEPQLVNNETPSVVEMPSQEPAPFTYNTTETVSTITETMPTNENLSGQNVLVEPTSVVVPEQAPTTIVSPQPEANFVGQQNVQPAAVAPQPVSEPQTLNVIPGMSQVQEPVVTPQSEVNNQNNTTM